MIRGELTGMVNGGQGLVARKMGKSNEFGNESHMLVLAKCNDWWRAEEYENLGG